VRVALEVNPGAVYVNIVREALLAEGGNARYQWPLAVCWAIGTIIVGYVFFWHAEEQYGRV
jgi:teichoic acid transport system permease protein